jgi:molybdate transport system regulatory protein
MAATLKLRIVFEEAMLGPGKAELLERIGAFGSISAAGRSMDMSYKRAWTLVEEMNGAFRDPLVVGARGGSGGGGAVVTEAGLEVLRLYRAIEDKAAATAGAQIAALEAMLRPAQEGDMSGGR